MEIEEMTNDEATPLEVEHMIPQTAAGDSLRLLIAGLDATVGNGGNILLRHMAEGRVLLQPDGRIDISIPMGGLD